MKTARPKRRGVGTKRLDLTDIRHALRDGRKWCALGTVYQPADAPSWWRVVTHANAPTDVIVECEIHPSGEICSPRLAAGIFDVPDLGDEVVIVFPDGERDFQPTIVGRLSSGSVPSVQGPAPGRIAIIRGEVVVHDGNGGAVSLALKSDVADVVTKFNGHTHILTLTSGTGTAAQPAIAANDPTGTTILKGK